MLKKTKELKVDYPLLITVSLLVMLGLIIIYGISAHRSLEIFNQTYYFLLRQIILGVVPGLILGFFFFKIDIKKLQKISFYLFLLNLIFLFLLFIPGLGIKAGGATRWLNLKIISFQPSEFLKLTLLLYLASLFSKPKINSRQKFFIFLFIGALVSFLLILQPDMSTLILILISCFIIYFLADTPKTHIFLIMIVFALGTVFLILFSPYRLNRFLSFINPHYDPLGTGYQLKQSLIAIGSGGIWGRGWGLSKQKLGFLPFPLSDTPFAIFAEEMGFVGSLVLISLFMLFFIRGMVIVKKVKEGFLKLTVIGFVSEICLAALINIGVLIGILPFTGIPLPFISYGGSHLAVEIIQTAIILKISRNL